jgi:hypothetical protein
LAGDSFPQVIQFLDDFLGPLPADEGFRPADRANALPDFGFELARAYFAGAQ